VERKIGSRGLKRETPILCDKPNVDWVGDFVGVLLKRS
jgi:hypothetical protein